MACAKATERVSLIALDHYVPMCDERVYLNVYMLTDLTFWARVAIHIPGISLPTFVFSFLLNYKHLLRAQRAYDEKSSLLLSFVLFWFLFELAYRLTLIFSGKYLLSLRYLLSLLPLTLTSNESPHTIPKITKKSL